MRLEASRFGETSGVASDDMSILNACAASNSCRHESQCWTWLMNSNLASSGNSSYMYRTTFSFVHSHFIKKSFRIRYLVFGTWNLVLLEVPSQSTHSQGNSIAACQIPSIKYQLPVTASAPTRSATSVSPGTACFWPFLLLYSASRQSCAGAGPGNASVQTPCARAASASAKLRQSCRPVRGPSSRALDS